MDTEHIPGGETWEPGATPAPQKSAASRRGAIWNPANRRNSREWALQMLFLADANPPPDGIDTTIAEFWELQAVEDAPPEKNLRDFAEKLVRGVWENRDAIDARISGYLTNWTIDRIGAVDRSVLRLAMYELFHRGRRHREVLQHARFGQVRERRSRPRHAGCSALAARGPQARLA